MILDVYTWTIFIVLRHHEKTWRILNWVICLLVWRLWFSKLDKVLIFKIWNCIHRSLWEFKVNFLVVWYCTERALRKISNWDELANKFLLLVYVIIRYEIVWNLRIHFFHAFKRAHFLFFLRRLIFLSEKVWNWEGVRCKVWSKLWAYRHSADAISLHLSIRRVINFDAFHFFNTSCAFKWNWRANT